MAVQEALELAGHPPPSTVKDSCPEYFFSALHALHAPGAIPAAAGLPPLACAPRCL
jgi:hypothetical protein